MVNVIPYRLGLDLGASSLGWAVIQLDQPNGQPAGILRAGVRIFEAGVEGDIEQGKDASRAVVRRLARQPRRMQWRRVRRKQKLFHLLQSQELLPKTDEATAVARKAMLDELDRDLTDKLIPAADHDGRQKLPYLLRENAAAGPVPAFELGRALYHLGQRRGYLSNRKSQDKEDEAGQVLSAISETQSQLEATGKTLGAHLRQSVTFRKSPRPGDERIRRRWQGRKHYQEEFARIREAQGAAHPQLTDEAWKKIETAIFFQRPLKSQKHLVGRCELELDKRGKGLRRCPLALPVAQEFRILQKVNDLRIKTPDGTGKPLTEKERQKLLQALNTTGEMKWNAIKKLLFGTKGAKTVEFTIEEWDDKLIGNRTNSKMIAVFGQRWLELSDEERTSISREVLNYRNPEALQKRAMKVWGLDEKSAWQLAHKTRLEDTYASHSAAALEKLLAGTPTVEGMRAGASYSTVRKAFYPEKFEAGKALSSLPPVNDWKGDIRNPAVIRAMTELRKVVNALIRKFGKPEHIHIELARDIRNSREKRKHIWKQNQDNQKRRDIAKAEIIKEAKIANPRHRDIERWLLAEECNFECPYCGEAINARKLLGEDAAFNVEHIFPRRYLDDSFLNKTIACRRCNDEKGDRTPAQAFTGARYTEILQRVERFKGTAREVKLQRFRLERPAEEDFVSRQMNDTRYNSKLAAQYLQLLYGGRFDASGEQRIICPTGMLTGKVRANWQLNDLLGDEDGQKEREDHRHHAIDAVVIGLMTQKQIQGLSNLAELAEEHHTKHFFDSIPWPWTTFKNDVAFAIEAVNVSHRPTHTLAGPLHAETIYSRNHGTEKKPEHRVRKHISKLTAKEISGNQIVDPHVRIAVQRKWEELGKGQPSKLWGSEDAANAENFPVLQGKRGGKSGSVIRKVRITTDSKPRGVGKGHRERRYASGKDSNYSSLIYAIVDKDGKEIKWEHEILDRLTAHQLLSTNHKKPGEKVLLPNESETRRFKFALRKNDMLEADGPDGVRQLYRVQKFSQNEIQLCEHNLTTVTNDQRTTWNRISSVDNLRKRNAWMIRVTLAGEFAPPDNSEETEAFG